MVVQIAPAQVDRQRRAHAARESSRYGFTSVITILRAPAIFAIGTAIQPMGPAPVMSTSSPTRSKARAVCTALPSGSEQERTSRGSSIAAQRFLFGTETYSANPPGSIYGRFLFVFGQRLPPPGQAVPAMTANNVSFYCNNFARDEIMDGACDLIDYAHEFVSITIGTGIVFCAQASQLYIWTSVPQIEAL